MVSGADTSTVSSAPTLQTATPTESSSSPSWVPPDVVDVLDSVPGWFADLLLTLTVLVVAYIVSRLLVQLLGRRIARRFRRPSLTRTALRGVRVGVFVFALLTILSIYGYRLSDIALSVTVFSAVVGVILAPIVGSVISGVFLLADQPYEIGDMIELADRGQRGFVEDITLRYTKLFTLDNTFIVIPNGSMRDRDVINYSAEDERVRLSLEVVVTYESDTGQARMLMRRAAAADDEVIRGGPDIRVGSARYPARPTVLKSEFGDDGIELKLRYWVKKPYKIPTIESRIRSRIWDAFEEADADIEFAYPHRHLVFDETSGTLNAALGDRDDRSAGIDDRSVQTSFQGEDLGTGKPGTDGEGSGTDGEGSGTDPSSDGGDVGTRTRSPGEE